MLYFSNLVWSKEGRSLRGRKGEREEWGEGGRERNKEGANDGKKEGGR